ncbi:lipoate--protein ligase family protein [Halanaeroarchaeum sulfurireducens]|uniref:Biotin/lipoate A/B protein ligase n=1 Tax=Halanaeroarchaeum sulfurireducens TaxID=1604004 RepID=A0A0F7P6I1_9EURY|nr:lipoate--protein ligase family protein [Halanaeroarchaeum sulfurireducens]AKH96771.1 biotin/lipoate A/B protein ligase [Halanaeroarchaeum sulfurireducens]ALG81173.1 biotin/lipoate A/B protein ligase [Halanaeroarchaeum sulfurireducens]
MRLLRGGALAPEDTRRILSWVAENDEAAIRVWQPPRQVVFGRLDATEPGYETAVERAASHGFETLERRVGGRAVAYTGRTVAFARYEPIDDARRGIGGRYEALSEDVARALDAVGVDARPGEPQDSFCPGEHSLQDGGKLVGLAQRVTEGAAVTAGVLVLDGHEAIGRVLADVYDALAVPFDPDSVGSVQRSGGDVDAVLPTLETALARGTSPSVLHLRQI